MTAEALLCRFLMRESTTPETVNEGVDWILTRLRMPKTLNMESIIGTMERLRCSTSVASRGTLEQSASLNTSLDAGKEGTPSRKLPAAIALWG